MKKTLVVKINKVSSNASIPKYAKHGDAGMDITATRIQKESSNRITYATGISLEIPEGYVGLVYPRSSIRKMNLTLANSVGVIDSGYRGEIEVTFNKLPYLGKCEAYKIGDRICQIVIMPYPQVKLIEVQELSDSERGAGGHGSSGN